MLEAFGGFPALQILKLGWNGIRDEGDALEDALARNDTLTELDLTNCRLGPQVIIQRGRENKMRGQGTRDQGGDDA